MSALRAPPKVPLPPPHPGVRHAIRFALSLAIGLSIVTLLAGAAIAYWFLTVCSVLECPL